MNLNEWKNTKMNINEWKDILFSNINEDNSDESNDFSNLVPQNNIKEYTFVGTCVNSFDEDGDCILSELPWSTVSDFAVAEENSSAISKEDFLSKVTVPEYLLKCLKSKSTQFLKTEDGVMMMYDPKSDIHYFFSFN